MATEITWGAGQLACILIGFLVYIIIIVCHSLLVIGWWGIRNNESNETEDFSILVIVSDLIIAITTLPLLSMLATGVKGSWICDVEAFQISFTHMFALWSIVLYSYSARQRIFNTINIPVWKELLFALVGALFILSVTIIPFGFGFHYHMAPGGYYCMFDWTGKDNISIFVISSVLVFVTSSIIFVLYVYTSIYLKVINVTSNPKINGKGATGKKQILNKKLQSAARKSFLIPMAFVACWGPYVLVIMYQMVASKYPTAVIDQVASTLATLNPLANICIFAFLNKKYNRKLRDILGFKRCQIGTVPLVSTVEKTTAVVK